MQTVTIRRFFLVLIVFTGFSALLDAEDKRSIPLDMYLIVDSSSSFRNAQEDAVAWINTQVVDRVLSEGDTITIWTAGETPELLFSGAISSSGGVSAEAQDIKGKLRSFAADGESADFSGALREAASRVSQTPQNRLSYTMLVTASAGGLERTLTGDARALLKWSRSEKYERWQALIVAPNIAQKVRDAAASYMRSL